MIDQRVVHFGRICSKRDQTAHATRRPDRTPALRRQAFAQANEQIAREQGFGTHLYGTLPQALGAEHRKIALIALLLQVLERAIFLSGFGKDKIPMHGGPVPLSLAR